MHARLPTIDDSPSDCVCVSVRAFGGELANLDNNWTKNVRIPLKILNRQTEEVIILASCKIFIYIYIYIYESWNIKATRMIKG